jgi:RNA polymerase primary sigma factor
MGESFDRVVEILLQDAIRRGGTVPRDRLLVLAEKFGLSTEELVQLKGSLRAQDVAIENDDDESEEEKPSDETTDKDDEPEIADVAAFEAALDTYLREARKVELLNPREELQLMRVIRAGEAASRELASGCVVNVDELLRLVLDGNRSRKRFIEANLRLVVSMAKVTYDRGDLSLEDLIQEGNFGLLRAVDRFDHTRGLRFSTYATWWIWAKIQRAIGDTGQLVRLPVYLRTKIAQVKKTEIALTRENKGHPPTTAQVAEQLGVTAEFVRFLRDLGKPSISLDHELENGRGTLVDALPASHDEPSPHSTVSDRQLLACVNQAVEKLDERQRRVMRMRFGMEDGEAHTLEQIGVELGITRERARQLQNMAIEKIKHPERSRAIAELVGPQPRKPTKSKTINAEAGDEGVPGEDGDE